MKSRLTSSGKSRDRGFRHVTKQLKSYRGNSSRGVLVKAEEAGSHSQKAGWTGRGKSRKKRRKCCRLRKKIFGKLGKAFLHNKQTVFIQRVRRGGMERQQKTEKALNSGKGGIKVTISVSPARMRKRSKNAEERKTKGGGWITGQKNFLRKNKAEQKRKVSSKRGLRPKLRIRSNI